MGEPSEAEVMVANASKEEAPDTPPVESTPEVTETTEIVETPETPPVAAGLSGDESVEDVEAYLHEKYKELSANDRDQLIRWRRDGHEGKAVKSELAAAKEAAQALEEVAEAWGVTDQLRKLGPTKFMEWAKTDQTPQPKETYGLDPNDPKDKLMIDMRRELDGMKEEKAKTTQQQEQEQIGKKLSDAYAGVIEKGMKDSPDLVKQTMWGLMNGLYDGDRKNIDPTAMAAAFNEAKKMVDSITQNVSTKTKEEIAQGKPKVPVLAEEKETPGEPSKDDDEDPFEAEERMFKENATREA